MTFANSRKQHVGNNLAHATLAYTSSPMEALASITTRHTIFDDIGRVTTTVAVAVADLFLVSLLPHFLMIKLTNGSLKPFVHLQVYRVHVLWASNWRISALPFLLWLALVILGIVTSDSLILHSDTLPDLTLLCSILTGLALNLVGTSMCPTYSYVSAFLSFFPLLSAVCEEQYADAFDNSVNNLPNPFDTEADTIFPLPSVES